MKNQNKKQTRYDGWLNELTNLGIEGKDKRLSYTVGSTNISSQLLRQSYEDDDVFKKIINREPDEMTREGFDIIIEDDDGGLAEKIQDRLDELQIENKINETMKWGRLFGGAALLFSVKGQDPEKPLDLKNKNQGLEYAIVCTKDEINPGTKLETDPKSENYRYPVYYSLKHNDGARIHASRLIKFYGQKLDYEGMRAKRFWGKSIIENLFGPVRNFNASNENVSMIIEEFIKEIFKIKDLIQMMSTGDSKELLSKRLQLILKKSSLFNAIIVDSDHEDFETKTLNVTGIKDLVNIVKSRLVTATDMPHTILFGEGPNGGIGIEGKSEKRDWYDHVKSQQEQVYRPAIEKIIDIELLNLTGKLPKYTLTFRPLWQPTEEEVLLTRKNQSEIDEKYYGMGVISTDEIRQSRFGNGDYSFETKLLESEPITQNIQ